MKEFKEPKKDIISVSQYLDRINLRLKIERARIIGEVTGIQEYPERSYLYFSIKDNKDGSTIKCFMWKRDFRLSSIALKDGLEIVIGAYPSVYKPSGSLTMQVENIELVGEGALQLAYEQLKKKLTAEGLFSEARKRKIPDFPHRIGVITSKSGAVINDFLSNIGKFGFEVLFVDSNVEGGDATRDLLSAISTLKNKDLDVLVIMRGGGSLESFQAFNNEVLVRAVAGFPAPVLTGIGHDKDAPLVSMVSDMNVSTPTAVANLLNSTWAEALHKINLSEERIFSSFNSLLRVWKEIENSFVQSCEQISFRISSLKEHLNQTLQIIELGSPERQLKRGYSIVRLKGQVIKSQKSTKKGDILDITVADGIINTQTI